MIVRTGRWAAAALAVLSVVAACGESEAPGAVKGPAGISVIATTTVLADLANAVGAGRVGATALVRSGVDPHDFDPTPKDLQTLKSATVIVRNGMGLDRWLDDAAKASGTKARVVDASSGAKLRPDDPHLWHDPRNAKVMVDNIAQALSSADSAGATVYAANSLQYKRELDALDAEIAQSIGTLSNKRVVTNHDAFGYYIDRYGLEFVGSVIPSFETSAEVSAADVDQLARAITAQGVKAVFTESALPSKVAQTIARDTGVKVVAGDEALYGDGLGPANSSGDTYLKMMRHNTKTFVDNLR